MTEHNPTCNGEVLPTRPVGRVLIHDNKTSVTSRSGYRQYKLHLPGSTLATLGVYTSAKDYGAEHFETSVLSAEYIKLKAKVNDLVNS